MSNVIIIGGGAAGMMAAITAARNNNKVTLIEKNEKLSGELAKLGLFLGGTLTPQGMVVLVIVLTIVVAAITWNILRKQRVTA